LVGRDATRDPEDDPASLQHGRPSAYSAPSGTSPPADCSAPSTASMASMASAPSAPPGSLAAFSLGWARTILSPAISSKAIDSGLRATDVTCGGTMAPRPSPSWLKY